MEDRNKIASRLGETQQQKTFRGKLKSVVLVPGLLSVYREMRKKVRSVLLEQYGQNDQSPLALTPFLVSFLSVDWILGLVVFNLGSIQWSTAPIVTPSGSVHVHGNQLSPYILPGCPSCPTLQLIDGVIFSILDCLIPHCDLI